MPTRNISTKLAIEGESQYRASIQAINSELRTLQSALKLTESEFRTNANSIEALSARGESLNNLYTAQSRKVEELRAALDNARQAEQRYAAQKAELEQRIKANEAALEKLKNTEGDTTAEQEKLTAENAALNKELEACEAGLAAAEKGVNNWQNQLNNAQIKLNDLDTEIKQNDQYLEEAKGSADGCATSIDQYGKKVKDADSDVRKFADAQKDASDASDRQNEALEALAAMLAAGGIKRGIDEITAALKACVSASADFEYAMSGVGAIANASSDEMDSLTAKAKEIGATTVFTAGQAAEALQYMALAGWTSEEMLSGVDGVISLAAASGENLATVSDIVTDALTAFGLSAEDSGHFVDVLASTAANSNTTVTMLGEAFKYAAPLAGALGYSVEDVAVAMGLMANNGVKSSMAGTTLRTMLTNLSGDVKLTAGAFGEVTISAANADGTIKPLSETLEELRFYFSQMTEAEKMQNAEAVAGKRAMSGLTAIMNSTQEDYDSLTASIQECTGAAKDMADTRMDNLTGQFTLMQSAFDAVKIAIGDDLNPALRDLAETGTDVLTWAAEFIEEHETIVPVVAAVAAGLTALTGGVALLAVGVKVIIPLIQAFNVALESNPIGLVAVGIATAIAALAAFEATIEKDTIPTVKDLTTATRDLQDAMESNDLSDNLAEIEATSNVADRYITKLEELEAAGLETTEQQKEYHNTLVLLSDLIPELSGYIDLETDSIYGGTEALRANTEEWKKNAKAQAYQDKLTELYEKQSDALIEREMNSIRLTEATDRLTEAQDANKAAHKRYGELAEEAARKADEEAKANGVLADSSAYLTQEYYDLENSFGDLEAAEWSAQQEINNCQKAIDEHAETADAAAEEIRVMEQAVENLIGAEEAETDAANDNTDAHVAGGAAITQIRDDLESLAKSYGEAYDAAYSSIRGQIGLFGEFKAELDEDLDSVSEMEARWKSQADAIAKYTENLQKAQEYNISDALLKELSDGSAESAAYLAQIVSEVEAAGAAMGESMPDAAATMVEEINSTFQSTQDAMSEYALQTALIEGDVEAAIAALQEEANAVDFTGFSDALVAAFAAEGIDITSLGIELAGEVASGVEAGADSAQSSIMFARDSMFSPLLETPDSVFQIGNNLDQQLAEAISGNAGLVTDAVTTTGDDIVTATGDAAGEAVDAFTEQYDQLQSETDSALSSVRSVIGGYETPMYNESYGVGDNITDGMINGIKNKESLLYSTIRNLTNNAIQEAKSAAATASPSKKTTKIFEDVGEGMVVGLEHKEKAVGQKAQDVVNEALNLEVPSVDLSNVYTGMPTVQPGDGTARLVAEISDLKSQVTGLMTALLSSDKEIYFEDGTWAGRLARKINRALA